MSRKFGLLLIATAIFAPQPVFAEIRSTVPLVEPGETLLLVEASGETEVKPDRLRISIGVETAGTTAAEALEANNRQMRRVIDALQAFDIIDDKFQTTDFSVEPQFPNDRRSGESTEILGYRAGNQVNVGTTDLAKAGEMIAAAFAAGANSVSGPYFGFDDQVESSATRQAERLALQQARAQADNMAAAMGMQVKRILRVSDRRIDFDREGSGESIVVTGSRITPTPIEVGTIPLSVEIFVEYALVSPS